MTKFFPMILFAPLLLAADYKVGVARQVITPDKPTYMIGYATRKHPSDGVIQDLWAKALAIEDNKGARTVIVTMDLANFSKPFTDDVAERIRKRFAIPRERLMLNVSHNHSGPLLWGPYPNPPVIFDLTPEQLQQVKDYTRWLGDRLVELAGKALQDLQPATLYFGRSEASFAVNRRVKAPDGSTRIGVNPAGPVDHEVPVLKVQGPDGKVKAVLFGYTCHNTTLGGNNYKFLGDYAGYAQVDVEKANPGATALFIALCGGDQNPRRTGTVQMAQTNGADLAAAVDRALKGSMKSVRGPVRSAYMTTPLKYKLRTREDLRQVEHGANPQQVRYARSMLKDYDALSRPYPYPLQAIRFGNDLTLLALGGEVVVEYQLWAKKQFGADGLIVAAYSNDEMAYIPTAKMLPEGGHEAVGAMFVYGHPGTWDPEIENTLQKAILRVMKKVGRTPARR